MCAGNGAEDQNQDNQHRAGRKRIAEQGEGEIATRKARSQDARADDSCEQEAGAEALREQPTRQRLRSAHAP